MIVLSLLVGVATVNGPVSAEHASAPEGAVRADARRLNLGYGSACVILDNGRARCWGQNVSGATGTGVAKGVLGRDETPDTLPLLQLGAGRTVKEIETASNVGCALLDNQTVRCWGHSHGYAHHGVPGHVWTGFYNSNLTDNPPVQTGGPVSALAVGLENVCVILVGGSVRCWGEGGAVNGLANTEPISDDEHPSSVGPIKLGGKATAITLGRRNACVILENGSIRCWGDDFSAPIQPGVTIGDDEHPNDASNPAFMLGGRKATAVSAGVSSACGLNDLGDVYCWGSGFPSRFANGNVAPAAPLKVDLNGKKVMSLDVGSAHACVVFDDGMVTCWGLGAEGRLGYASDEDIGDDEPPTAGGFVALGAGRTATAVSAGLAATCVLLDNDTVRCWGDADEIGSGQAFDIGDDELPTAIPPVNYIGTAAFRPLTPKRILDTRASEPSPTGAPKGFVSGDGSIDVSVTDVGGVPAKDVYAVVLNVTLTESAGPGFVTAYPKGVARPTASNMNVSGAGQTVANLVIVPVGDDGEVTLYIGGPGGGHLIADVFGYYEQKSSSTDGRLIGVTPARVFDTRPGESAPGPKGKIPAGGTITVQMTGANGVPSSGVSSVVVNLTGTEAGGPGFVTAYPSNVPLPTTSNVNLVAPGATRANSVIVPVAPDGAVSFYSLSATHLLADITGYYTDDTAEDTDDGLFVPLAPSRLLDTRTTQKSPIAANGTAGFAVTGKLGIPSTANAVVLNLTVTETGGIGFVTGWPSDVARPTTSNVNYLVANDTVANAAILPLSTPSGRISLFTLNRAHLIADTSGYHL